MRTKICRYCGKGFTDIDFPAQFGRMVTCGNVECMRLRRLERIKAKPDNAREDR